MSNTFSLDPLYALKLGDLGPPLVVTLKTSSNGASAAPFVLEDSDAVTLRYLDPNGAEHTVSMAIIDAANGVISYSWQSGDLPVASTKVYQGEIRVTRSGEDFPETFPGAGTITWRVNPAIDGSAPTEYGTLAWLGPVTYTATGSETPGDDVTINTPQTMADATYMVLPVDRSGDQHVLGLAISKQTPTTFAWTPSEALDAGDVIQFAIFGRVL